MEGSGRGLFGIICLEILRKTRGSLNEDSRGLVEIRTEYL
jgi:hypothetical protein